MTWSEIAVVVVVVLLLVLWWVWVAASRLDRLHRKVATSRQALDTQLVRRASVAAELAASGALDPVSSVLVADAAWEALSVGRYGATDLVAALPDLADVAELGAVDAAAPVATRVTGSGTGPGTTATADDDARVDPCAELTGAEDRAQAESELSRTVRAALSDPEEIEELRAVPLAAELLDALAGAWYRVQLARRFHNEAVAQTQRMRRKTVVRLLHLHGHAAMPATVEIDDGWPDGLPRAGHVS